jgi:UDP-N-acetylglucosamine--N-acetylmuramyl-(pentapeptide) pyrophosphoryl-undecaprenol N-acetylglucosamine transferase
MSSKNNKVNRMVITGGGTGGHVFPALRVANSFKRTGTDVLYIGSKNGLEMKLSKEEGIKFRSIFTGKLRRYFSWKNFIDPFFVLIGFFQSYYLLRKFNPQIIFSKGGYVSLPVCIAGKILNIPIVLHESDLTPGLANKILIKFANKICISFKESFNYIKSNKLVLTGNPIREELFEGNINKAKIITDFNSNLPVILVCGGSLGSRILNELIRKSLVNLLEFSQIILQCGKGKKIILPDNLKFKERFFQVEFIGVKAMANFYKLADLIISRAGAGQITELAYLGKTSVLIPLSLNSSRGDQVLNASLLQKNKAALVFDEAIDDEDFSKEILKLLKDKELQGELSSNIKNFYFKDSIKDIMKVIKNILN